jgi:porin
VVDQTIWRPDPAGARAVGVFARIMGAPGDRNLVDFSVNAGITMKAPVAGRDNDSVGIGYGLAQVSPTAVSFDKDANFYHGPYPIRGSESFIEVTYQAAITPWLTVQPDLQYVWTPGGGIRDPLSPDRRVGNETLLGLRTNIGF